MPIRWVQGGIQCGHRLWVQPRGAARASVPGSRAHGQGGAALVAGTAVHASP